MEKLALYRLDLSAPANDARVRGIANVLDDDRYTDAQKLTLIREWLSGTDEEAVGRFNEFVSAIMTAALR